MNAGFRTAVLSLGLAACAGSAFADRPAGMAPLQYPHVAKQLHVEGMVVVAATVGEDGRVIAVRRIEGNRLLAAAACAAVKDSTFAPAAEDGRPAPYVRVIAIEFRLP